MCGLSREKLSNFSKIENCKEISIQEFVPCDNHIWFLRYDVQLTELLGHFLGHLGPFFALSPP